MYTGDEVAIDTNMSIEETEWDKDWPQFVVCTECQVKLEIETMTDYGLNRCEKRQYYIITPCCKRKLYYYTAKD